ncbi:hypothetical protein NDU88_004799 [Pleurodeles waltl]|uniref:Uncharacterized protein n=1 Tax=Pleurodeles waltl TaxID=8319 RepID=A0AAV7V271_PLEWA|nr:hypothetical protein NDU88_004799 [Pleurodeles waltl]
MVPRVDCGAREADGRVRLVPRRMVPRVDCGAREADGPVRPVPWRMVPRVESSAREGDGPGRPGPRMKTRAMSTAPKHPRHRPSSAISAPSARLVNQGIAGRAADSGRGGCNLALLVSVRSAEVCTSPTVAAPQA